MSTQTKVVLGLIALGVGLSIFLATCHSNPTVTVIRHDTLWKDHFIYDTMKGGKIDTPQTVIKYVHTDRDTSMHVYVYHDTLKIVQHDTVTNTIAPEFITEFPQSPKLILGEFRKQEIVLNLLGIDGQIVSKSYVPDYENYNYEFSSSELKFYPIPKSKAIPNFFKSVRSESFMYTTYNPFTNGATVRIDYSLMYKKFGLIGMAQFSTDQTPHPNVGIGLRVQLK